MPLNVPKNNRVKDDLGFTILLWIDLYPRRYIFLIDVCYQGTVVATIYNLQYRYLREEKDIVLGEVCVMRVTLFVCYVFLFLVLSLRSGDLNYSSRSDSGSKLSS